MGNPILDPIFSFFSAIWNSLSGMVNSFGSAFGDWFHQALSYTYAGIPVGPLILIAVGMGAGLMLWGFIKLKQLFSDE